MIVTCSNCGMEFNKPAYYVKRGMKNHFCSQKCRGEFVTGENHPRYNSVKTTCDYCGDEVIVKKYSYDRAERHFCDIDCKHNYNKDNRFWGEEHSHNYQGDVEVKCSFCGKEFSITAGQYNYSIKNRNGNFCCSHKCSGQFNKKRFSGENAHRFGREGLKGELNPSWKGGLTPFVKAVRLCGNYYRWKNKILDRDDYKCQSCGLDVDLIIHHKIPLIKIVNDNGLENMEQAKGCTELWNIDNGITFCVDCHKEEHLSRGDI